MRIGIPQGIVVMREWEDLGCAVGYGARNCCFAPMDDLACAFLSLFSLFAFILQILTRISKR